MRRGPSALLALVVASCAPPPLTSAPPPTSAPATASPAAAPSAAAVLPITAPPQELVTRLHLSPKYTKYLGVPAPPGPDFPILASSAASDDALREARWLILRMTAHRPELLAPLAAAGIRYVVMASTELTTDVPEHADLSPRSYWDRRARGLGATRERPAVSGGEENLLAAPGDPYAAEAILPHEFAHALHAFALVPLDGTFQARLEAAYASARARRAWDRIPPTDEPLVYAMENPAEYWAEATQSWFDTNRRDDNQHGPIATRDAVKRADPAVAALLTEVYGDGPFRYQHPLDRAPSDRAHLAAGGAPIGIAPFVFRDRPDPLPEAAEGIRPVRALPDRSPGSGVPVQVVVANRRAVPVELLWVDFEGRRSLYATVQSGATYTQSTYAGHVWVVRATGRELGGFVARAGAVELR